MPFIGFLQQNFKITVATVVGCCSYVYLNFFASCTRVVYIEKCDGTVAFTFLGDELSSEQAVSVATITRSNK